MNAPLSIRQLNSRLPHTESTRKIGAIQWGLASNRIAWPLFNGKSSQSKTPTVIPSKRNTSLAGKVNQPNKQDLDTQGLLDEYKKNNAKLLKKATVHQTQQLQDALVTSAIKRVLVDADHEKLEELKNDVLAIDPIAFLKQQPGRPNKVIHAANRNNGSSAPIAQARRKPSRQNSFETFNVARVNSEDKFKAYLHILALPSGSELLLKRLNLTGIQPLLLETLAKSYVASGRQQSFSAALTDAQKAVDDVLGYSKPTVAQMALVAAYHELTTEQRHHNRWAIAAFNNGLEDIGSHAQFIEGGDLHRCEQRIHKMVRWAKRAERRTAWSRLLPNYKKSPFRAFRMGYRGANQGGHEVGNANNQKTTEKDKEFEKLSDDKHKKGIVGITTALHHLVDNIQGASRYRSLSGGAYGFGTKGISGVFSQLLTGFLFRFRVILAWTRPRLAGIEVAMPAYNMELMLYSQKNIQTQVGLGASAGPSFGPLEVAGGLDVNAYQSEHKQFDGVVLRLPRVRGKEQELREEFKSLLGSIMAYGEAKPNGSLLKTILAEHPELSLSLMNNAHEKRVSHSIKIFGQAGIRAGIAKIYAGISGEISYLSDSERLHHDAKGQMRIDKQVIARGGEANAGAGAEFRLGSSSDSTRANLVNMDVLSAEWSLARAGRQIRRDIVQHRGRYSTDSFIEIEYQSLNDFEAAIQERKSNWVTARALRKNIEPKVAQQHIDEFIRQAKAAHRPGLSYATRYELRAECAEQLNALASLKRFNSEDASKHLDDQIDMILNDPQSFAPTSFRMFDRQEESAEYGVDAVLTAKAIDKIEAVHVPIRMM